MTKSEFVSWMEGYLKGLETRDELIHSEDLKPIIEKAQELKEEFPEWFNQTNKLIGEYVSKLPGPNDWSVDLDKWPNWSVKTE